MRHGFIHVVLDDYYRLAYAEIHYGETGATAAAVLHRATAWFTARGVSARWVLTDDGGCYRSRDWAAACAELGITAKRTRPYRPPLERSPAGRVSSDVQRSAPKAE
ncbi:DDE-type integrase/transposase/recombinase [Blastococcus sp. SYSU D00813]